MSKDELFDMIREEKDSEEDPPVSFSNFSDEEVEGLDLEQHIKEKIEDVREEHGLRASEIVSILSSIQNDYFEELCHEKLKEEI